MKCIILAAGKGTRMSPLTDNTPKPLLPIRDNTPNLERTLGILPERITDVIIITNYLEEQFTEFIKQYVEKKTPKFSLRTQTQTNLNGSYGAVMTIDSYIEDGESFLVLNGDDVYFKPDLERLIEHDFAIGLGTHQEMGDGCSLKDGKIVGLFPALTESHPRWINTGAYVVPSTFFGLAPVGVPERPLELGFPHTLLGNEEIIGFPDAVFFTAWLPVNTKEHLEFARSFLKEF